MSRSRTGWSYELMQSLGSPGALLAALCATACAGHADLESTASEAESLVATVSAEPESAAASARILPEVKVSGAGIIDYEFDWGRDGTYCSSCNQGDGNNRLTFSDPAENLWVAHVDPTTGDFIPTNGAGELVDTGAAIAKTFGNGPEWMFGSAGSQIVYTKYRPDMPQSTKTASIGVAQMTDGVWSGAIVDGGYGKQSPMGTLDTSDPAPRMSYQSKGKIYWRVADDPSTEQLIDLGALGGGVGTRRWVDGTHLLVFTAPVAPDAAGVSYAQVFTYDTDTSTLEQLTFDPVNRSSVFMWRAPEYGGEYVFFSVDDATNIGIYRFLDDGTGQAHWTLVNLIAMPPGSPTVWSPEPFVFKGHSYVFFELTSSLDFSTPSQLAMVGIDPAHPLFQPLTNDTRTSHVRSDPEYYITANGPYIYYNRYVTTGGSRPPRVEGVYRVDTYLGPE